MTTEQALQLAVIIINELEGGYYHPDMKAKLKGGSNIGDSGETMYGLDRQKGNIENSDAGKKFFALVDKYYSTHHADTGYYNDKANGQHADIPASVGTQLKQLAAEVIYNRFNNYAAALDKAAKEKVLSDPALLIQFFYAVYNGQGNFNKFATVMNDAYSKGTTDAKKLYQLLQRKRRTLGKGDNGNKLFRKGADKLDIIIKKYYGLDYAEKSSKTWLYILGGLALFLLLRNKKK